MSSYAGLLAAGIRIYEYLPRMLHAKTVVVDGQRAMLGTANLDYRSLFVNFELNLLSRNAGVSTELEQQFLRDLREAERILPVPWGQRGWTVRFFEALGWLLRRWL